MFCIPPRRDINSKAYEQAGQTGRTGGRRGGLDGQTGCEKVIDPAKGLTLVMLSITNSIDALAVGLSMSMIRVSIWVPAPVIGIVAGVFTIIGLQLGKRVGAVSSLRRYAVAMGGTMLLMIGFKILHDHGTLQLLS